MWLAHSNRQVQVFFAIIAHFRPAFVLMENVVDIFKKEDGAYFKFALGSLLKNGYQARIGCIDAMSHGVPQGRWRCVPVPIACQLA